MARVHGEKAYLPIGLILLIAFLIRILSIISLRVTPTSDALDFHTIAVSLTSGSGYSLDGVPTATRAPGYPLFLAALYLFWKSVIAAQLVQACLETLICLLLYVLGVRLFDRAVGLFAAAFWAAYPTSVLQANLVVGESLFTVLIVTSVIVLSSPNGTNVRNLLIVGVLWGFAALVRPFFVLAPFILAGWSLWEKKTIRSASMNGLLVGCVVAVTVGPWVVRNALVLGTPTLDTNAGVNLWMGNNPRTTGAYLYPAEDNPLVNIRDEVQRDRMGYALAWEFMRTSPWTSLAYVPRKIAFLFSSESPTVVSLTHRVAQARAMRYAEQYASTPLGLHFGVNIFYVAYVVFGIFGLLGSPPHAASVRRLVVLLVGYWILIHSIFVGLSRYHYPLMPFFVVFAAYSFGHFTETRLHLSRSGWTVFGVSVAGLSAILAAEIVTVVNLAR